MTIGADSTIAFHGTTDAVDDGTTGSVADGVMSLATDISAWTNDDDALLAQAVLTWQYATGTPDGNISLHIRPINIDGTSDPDIPTATDPIGFVGNFEVSSAMAAATDVPHMVSVPLLNFMMKTSQEYEFYIYNQSGVLIAANWDLDITPMTVGPHA